MRDPRMVDKYSWPLTLMTDLRLPGNTGVLARSCSMPAHPPFHQERSTREACRPLALLLLLLPLFLAGCQNAPTDTPDRIMIIPGAGGDGAWYGSLRQGLSAGGAPLAAIDTIHWGMPAPLYMFNLQNQAIHHAAERKLAERIVEYRQKHPHGQLAIVGHSAGCGVTLGALARLPEGMMVDRVILLAPSVSPTYDLAPPLRHVEVAMHVFYSDGDQLWLHWRTGTFGTYDNVRTPAAGNQGFGHTEQLPPNLGQRFHQHPYDPAWANLGNDGGHTGALAHDFAHQILGPMIMG